MYVANIVKCFINQILYSPPKNS